MGRTKLPFISRQLRMLNKIQALEMDKQKRECQKSNFAVKCPSIHYRKIFRNYSSEDVFKERTFMQKLLRIKEDLESRHTIMEREFCDDFHRNYPFEDTYEEEMNFFNDKMRRALDDKDYQRAVKIQEEIEDFKNLKHNEYMDNMGRAYKDKLKILKDKFEEENQLLKLKFNNYKFYHLLNSDYQIDNDKKAFKPYRTKESHHSGKG